MNFALRLAKHVATLAACSRREAELYIQGGWVQVDGQVIVEPQFMVQDHCVVLAQNAQLAPIEAVTLLVNQPAALDVSSDVDRQWNIAHLSATSRSSLDVSNQPVQARHFRKLIPVMALPPVISGMSVYTQDRRFATSVHADFRRFEEEFIVEVEGEIVPYGLQRLRTGLSFKGASLRPCQVSWQNEVRLRFALKGAQTGQLQSMCRDVGLTAVSIKRIRIGQIALGKILPGEWRFLELRERF
jgi:23S rRNA pseudouridine2604 synthase